MIQSCSGCIWACCTLPQSPPCISLALIVQWIAQLPRDWMMRPDDQSLPYAGTFSSGRSLNQSGLPGDSPKGHQPWPGALHMPFGTLLDLGSFLLHEHQFSVEFLDLSLFSHLLQQDFHLCNQHITTLQCVLQHWDLFTQLQLFASQLDNLQSHLI